MGVSRDMGGRWAELGGHRAGRAFTSTAQGQQRGLCHQKTRSQPWCRGIPWGLKQVVGVAEP